MTDRLICTECGTGNYVMSEPHRAITSDYVTCTDCGQTLSQSRDIAPYAEGRTLVWDGPYLAATGGE